MSANQDFWELYKHPLWQEKRLKIMERAKFGCENCGEKNSTLNVHHGYYERDKKPWEYDDDTLHCLCEPCHKEIQELGYLIRKTIAKIQNTLELEIVRGFVDGMDWNRSGRKYLGFIGKVESFYLSAFASAIGVPEDWLEKSLSEKKIIKAEDIHAESYARWERNSLSLAKSTAASGPAGES